MGVSKSPYQDGNYKHDKRTDQTVIIVDAGEGSSLVVDRNGNQRTVMNYDLDDNRKEV